MNAQQTQMTDARIHRAQTARSAVQEGTAFLGRAGIESARLDAEILLATALGMRREDLYIRSEKALSEQENRQYRHMLSRRAGCEPVAYIIGHREFWSLAFRVTPGVLIPRPETELLVELALTYLPFQESGEKRSRRGPVQAADLGTGSGAIAVSLAKERKDLEVWATDLSPEAVKLAQLNATRHGVALRTHFLVGDLFAPVQGMKASFHIVVSNPPYIAHHNIETLPRDVRDWEPATALDGGADGLEFYRRIIGEASDYLREDGFLLLEIGADLEAQVRHLFAASGNYQECVVHLDYAGSSRVVSACKALRRA